MIRRNANCRLLISHPLSAPRPRSSSPEALGRTATARASTRKLRDELLNSEICYSLAEAKVIIEAWRRYYNTERPHSSLGYKPPAPEAIVWPAPQRGSAPPSAQTMAGKPIMH